MSNISAGSDLEYSQDNSNPYSFVSASSGTNQMATQSVQRRPIIVHLLAANTVSSDPSNSYLVYSNDNFYVELREILVSIPAGAMGPVRFMIAPAFQTTPATDPNSQFTISHIFDASSTQPYYRFELSTALEPGAKIYFLGGVTSGGTSVQVSYRISGIISIL